MPFWMRRVPNKYKEWPCACQKWETQNFQAINMGIKQIWQSEIIG
jgi:hypothetical protein